MSWFKRVKDGILTRTEDKKEAPDGMWKRCPKCKSALYARMLEEHFYTCPKCEHHLRIGSGIYVPMLFDEEPDPQVLFDDLLTADPLDFEDTKKYMDRVEAARNKTNLPEAITIVKGMVGEESLVAAIMDFSFIGGSMGAVMGEKIAKAIDLCIEEKLPLLIISKSGGARMMEGALSLMQMAKISAKLAQLSEAGLPFISLLTDPTTGGVTASFAMLGDFNIAEQGALIGFAGPRVIKETIGKSLPEGFQSAEFLLEHGFLDFIVHRRDLKTKISTLLKHLR